MGEVIEINGPIVTIKQEGVLNGEQVKIGRMGLIGEVIHLRETDALVQVYESTESLRPGEEVIKLGHPLSVELGPGMLGQIFDGVQRPLNKVMQLSGQHIGRGLEVDALDRDKVWHYVPETSLQKGSTVSEGQTIGHVLETETIVHYILVPPGTSGEVISCVSEGDYSIEEILLQLKDVEGRVIQLKMYHKWPVRKPRPYKERLVCGSIKSGKDSRISTSSFPLSPQPT